MRVVEEVDPLGDGDFIWHAYDPLVRADLFSTGLATPAGTCLIDPIRLAEPALAGALAASAAAAIVVTNVNHARDAAAFARELSVPVYARAAAAEELADAAVVQISAEFDRVFGLQTFIIDGGAAGEIALLRRDARGGTLVVGDAIINSGSYGFTLLPAKYCSDPKLLRNSLRQLLDYDFERILFAHGTPILSGGRDLLGELLESR